MNRSGIKYFSLLSLLLTVIDSILVKGPEDFLAVRGSNVTPQCVTNRSEPIQWEVYKEPPIYWRLIYTGYPSIIPSYLRHKFDVTIDSTQNKYNLTIKNIQDEDSGTYRCIDYYGLAPKEEDLMAEVIVVADKLSCSGRICQQIQNQSDCVFQEMIDVNCSLSYSGKRTPTLLCSIIVVKSRKNRQLYQPMCISTLRTGGWRSAIITSRVIINSTLLSHRSYIKCNVTDIDSHNKTFKVNPISLSKVYWISDVIDKTDSIVDINNADVSKMFKSFIIISTTSAALIGTFLIIYIRFCRSKRHGRVNQNVEHNQKMLLQLDQTVTGSRVDGEDMSVTDHGSLVLTSTFRNNAYLYEFKLLNCEFWYFIPTLELIYLYRFQSQI